MKKNFKLFSVGAAVLLGIAGLASCGKGVTVVKAEYNVDLTGYHEYSGTLVYSGPASQRSWVMGVCNNYNRLREEKGLGKINFQYVDHGEDKVDSEVTDWNNGPDVYAFASDKILPLYQAGALANVSGDYETFIGDTMSDAAVDAGTFAGSLKAYPYAGDNGYFLFYNKSLLTSEDIKSVEGILAKAKENNQKFAYPVGDTPFYSVGTLFSFGARYNISIDNNGVVESIDADFDGENGVKAGLALMKIINDPNWQNAQAAPTTANGIIACVDGSWNAASYQQQMGDNYACAKLPEITVTYEDADYKANLGSFLGYKLYGVNPLVSRGNTERIQAAHDFAKFLTCEETQSWRFENFSIAPTNEKLAATSEVQNNPAVAAINAQSEFAVPQTATPANLWTAPNVLTQSIINKKVTDVTTLLAALKTMNTSIENINAEGN